MPDIGIICEMNPIHNGHKYIIDQAKAMEADRVVCIMSGNTVQRGEFAVADKYLRAEALLKCGADMVIEIPFPWCSGSAEHFANGSIEIAKSFCDILLFGSECGNIDALTKAATVSNSESFRAEFKERLTDGIQAARLYHDMIKERCGVELSSNDLLGVEYIRAGLNLNSNLIFKTVTRQGDAYNAQSVSNNKFPSATAIRRLWQSEAFNQSKELMPEEAFNVYKRAYSNGELTDYGKFDSFWLSFFRLHESNNFEGIAGADGGLANRICTMARSADSYSALLDTVKTKRYTDGHIRRVMLYCLAGVTEKDLKALPTETLLLAVNEKGRALLSEKRKSNVFRIVTKPADLDFSLRQNILTGRINSVFSLSQKRGTNADSYLKSKPFIE